MKSLFDKHLKRLTMAVTQHLQIVLLGFLLLSCSKSSNSEHKLLPTYYQNLFDRLSLLNAAIESDQTTNSSETTDQSCNKFYQPLVSKKTLDIQIFFGYKDTRPSLYVGDIFEKTAFINQLISTCKPDIHVCGFIRSSEDSDLFVKNITGPDKQTIKVELKVFHSSVGANDQLNRLNPFQTWQSKYAESSFAEALRTADVVFYNGHSRAGGGPDFYPPKLQKSGEVDSTYYKQKKPGLRLLEQHLSSTQENPSLRILGLFSCISGNHFSNLITKKSPKTAIISSSTLLYYVDAVESSLGALHGILGFYCKNKLARAVETTRANKGSQIENFYE